MTILSRLLHLCKADLHGVMDQIEDKGLLLKQHLREMEEVLSEQREHRVELQRACRQLQKELEQQEEEQAKLSTEVDLAIGKDKDDLAKMLIRRRRTMLASCAEKERQLARLVEEEAELGDALGKEQQRYDELKARATEYFRLQKLRGAAEGFAGQDGCGLSPSCNDEEIEFELLQRKEAMRQGGAA
jgi:phage shock protein A